MACDVFAYFEGNLDIYVLILLIEEKSDLVF